MRLDKYLKVSRIIKRRSVANDACSTGHITVNGKEAKPGTDVRVGAAVPDNKVDHGGLPGFHKMILHFQPPLHIVKAVDCAVTLQPKGCGHQ